MNNDTINTTVNHGTLAPVLSSAVAIKLEDSQKIQPSAGNRFARIIAKGKNTKLAGSMAVEVPAVNSLASYLEQAAIKDYLVSCVEKLQDSCIRSQLEAGTMTVQHSSISAAALAEYLTTSAEGQKLGQLSEASIKAWFESEVRDVLFLKLVDKLQLSEVNTDDEKRIEQIGNQTRDQLAKLSAKKTVMFDERVKKALNWAIDSVLEVNNEDSMALRLQAKLNASVEDVNLADMLGI